MKHLKLFKEAAQQSVVIDGETYVIKKAKFDMQSFDEDGTSLKYPSESYVVIDNLEPKEDPRVRIFDGIFDENNRRNAFDPYNYSTYIMARLKYGDECYLDELYEIISTTNKSGEVYYEYLDPTKQEHQWSNGSSNNGIFIHSDLIKKSLR